jgi:thiamine-phosphate pyrophosphorylase
MSNLIISYHLPLYKEEKLLLELFRAGLQRFHLRKHDFTAQDYRRFIEKIPEQYHNRMIVHQYYELLSEYDLQGYYLSSADRNLLNDNHLHDLPDAEKLIRSTFANSLEELIALDASYDYIVLGPVFKSISRPNLTLRYTHADLTDLFSKHVFRSKVIAVGGIKEDTTEMALNYGFHGVAMLGVIWASYLKSFRIKEVVNRFELIESVVRMMSN